MRGRRAGSHDGGHDQPFPERDHRRFDVGGGQQFAPEISNRHDILLPARRIGDAAGHESPGENEEASRTQDPQGLLGVAGSLQGIAVQQDEIVGVGGQAGQKVDAAPVDEADPAAAKNSRAQC